MDREYRSLEFDIAPLDDDEPDVPMRGIAIGLLIALPMWIVGVASWRFGWLPSLGTTRLIVFGVAKVLAVVAVSFVVLAVSRRITDSWRKAHPESAVVDWLRRSGL